MILNTAKPSEIWTKDEQEKPCLIASHCMECGRISFPSKEVCPYCMTNGKSNQRLIGRTGEVVSVTTCHAAPKGFHAPYCLGIVEIEGGVHVLTQIGGTQIKKGTAVELVDYLSRQEENEEEVYRWKYQVIGECTT
jgi:uncharacterized OB-fold protein